MPTSRLEAFSDGVLAIIITIMVLELHPPEGKDLAALWHTTGTSLLTYLLSFVNVGIYWVNHHHMFQVTSNVTGGVLWANLALLFSLSLLPFTTEWMDHSDFARTPVVVYGVDLLAAGMTYYLLQTLIIRSQRPDSPLRAAIGRDRKGRSSMLIYALACVIAIVVPGSDGRPGIWIALACYVFVALMWIVPDRRIESRITTMAAAELAGPDPGPGPDTEAGR